MPELSRFFGIIIRMFSDWEYLITGHIFMLIIMNMWQ